VGALTRSGILSWTEDQLLPVMRELLPVLISTRILSVNEVSPPIYRVIRHEPSLQRIQEHGMKVSLDYMVRAWL
jgi:hypothetical protein